MHKDIFAVRALNKAIALGSVKPFHHTVFCHKKSLHLYLCQYNRGAGWDGRKALPLFIRTVLTEMVRQSFTNGLPQSFDAASKKHAL